jgi:hypothetical protein
MLLEMNRVDTNPTVSPVPATAPRTGSRASNATIRRTRAFVSCTAASSSASTAHYQMRAYQQRADVIRKPPSPPG